MKKRLLTFDDLYDFYSNHKRSVNYSADKNNNGSVVVQVEGNMNFSEDDYDPELGLLKVHIKSSHIGINRNKSSISKEVMEQAKESIKNRPLLGCIHELHDGSHDFAGHEMYIDEDTDEIVYEEVPVGIVPESCNAKLVYDEEMDKTYLEVDAYIFEEYSKAAEIIENKKESKVSVELALLDYGYNAKEKSLTINKFYFSGICILGVSRDGRETEIQEGMLGSKLTLKDFKAENNSMFSELEEEKTLVETLENLNSTITTALSKFNINQTEDSVSENYKEGGTEKVKTIEEEKTVVEEETKIFSDTPKVETEACGGSDKDEKKLHEEIETPEEEDSEVKKEDESKEETDPEEDKKEETFEDETKDEEDSEVEPKKVDNAEEDKTEEEPTDEENPIEDPEADSKKEEEACGGTGKKKKYSVEVEGKTLEFEVSLNETIMALDRIVNETYAEADNCWYCVEAFDGYVIMQSYCSGAYKQSFKQEGDVFSLVGDRVEVFPVFVTKEEQAQLDELKTNYSSISSELAQYKQAEEDAEKEAVFSDKAYVEFAEADEFKAIKESMSELSIDELKTKCELAFAACVKKTGTFSLKEEKAKKPAMFGFAKVERETSFLDGLLKNK